MPSSAKYRNAVNCASIRFNHELFVGVYAISTLFASAHSATRRHFLVVRWGEKLSHTIAIRTSAGHKVRR